MATQSDICSICSFRIGSIPELVSHIHLVHYSESTFSITCGIDGCVKHFKKCSSYLSHVYRHHRKLRAKEHEPERDSVTFGEPKDTLTVCEPTGDTLIQEESAASRSSLLDHSVFQLLGTDNNEQKKKSALLILEFKEVRGLSDTAIKAVVSGCNDMIDYNNKRLPAALSEQLSKDGIYVPDSCIQQVFQKVSSPFEGMENVYLQEKFFREEFGCIVSYYTQRHNV